MSTRVDETTPSEDLMAAVASGDRFAFEILVRRHQDMVLNIVYRFIGNRTDAEDLAQEVFIRVWEAAGRYRPTAKFTTWIYRITANLCINELKSARRRKRLQFSLSHEKRGGWTDEHPAFYAEKVRSPEELLLDEEQKRLILAALQSLSDNQRMALVLKRYEGLSYAEIAQVLGKSVPAVDALLVRAKRNLRKKLASHEKKSQGLGSRSV
jgi:RNA polymerase sigma-70 factor (ECF subfamily)